MYEWRKNECGGTYVRHVIWKEIPQHNRNIIVAVVNQYRDVLWSGSIVCNWCNDIEGFGHMGVGATRPRLREAQGCCIFYIESCRQYYNEVRARFATEELQARPKREPDDPYYRLEYGEGLLSSVLSSDDYKDWYYLSYMPSWRRRVYMMRTSGKGACAPEERVRRGVEDETKWAAETTLNDFMEK